MSRLAGTRIELRREATFVPLACVDSLTTDRRCADSSTVA